MGAQDQGSLQQRITGHCQIPTGPQESHGSPAAHCPVPPVVLQTCSLPHPHVLSAHLDESLSVTKADIIPHLLRVPLAQGCGRTVKDGKKQ